MQTHPLDEWIELHRRRPLRPDERDRLQARLAHDPALRAQWEEELGLTRLLRDLPDAPVPSNHNAAVWATVGRAPSPARSIDRMVAWIRLPRPTIRVAAAACALALLVGGLGHNQYQSFHRNRMAESLAEISRSVVVASAAAELAPAEILQDFEAIYRLGQVRPLADEELLAALQ